MVQPSQSWVRYDPTGARTDSSGGWCLFPEAEMRAVFVVIADVFREQPFQMAFIERDDVVQQVPAAASHPELGDAILPGAFEGSLNGQMLRERTATGTSNPYLASRSKIRNLEAESKGNASRNCWTIHELVGCLVTLKCRMRRRWWLMMKKP